MQRRLAIVAGLVGSAILAACSSNGSSIPSTGGPQGLMPGVRVPINSPYIMYGPGGRVAHIMLTREAQRRLAPFGRSRTGGGGNLTYHGGPVQNTPSVYVVFWGFCSGSNDPSGEAPYLTNFLGNVGGSSWMNIDTQYTDGSGGIGNPSGQLKGTWCDSSSVPSRPSQSNVAAEAVKAAGHFGGNAGPNVSYFVALPQGHDPSGFKTKWCAFHSDTSASYGTVSYTDFPYQTDAGSSCGENFNGLAPGLLDGVSIVGGHEYAETQTDPQPSTGWVDSSGAEIGDKCAWNSASTDITLSGSQYAVQPLWDNKVSGCATSGP